MNNYLSLKLKVISFFAIILVVFLHSYDLTIKVDANQVLSLSKGYSTFIQEFISQGITRIAVPIFFTISGYLFFLGLKGSSSEFEKKMKKRVKTLLFPYLLWSILGILLYLVLQSLPVIQNYFTRKLISEYSVKELLNTIFLNPIPYQFWFIRDLIILTILSPILFWLLRFSKVGLLLFLLGLWFYNFDLIIIANEALLFFVIGGYLSLHQQNWVLQHSSSKNALILFVSWITIVLIKTIILHLETSTLLAINIIHKIGVLIGVLAVWGMYDFMVKKINSKESKYSFLFSLTFFIYAFHEPVLTILKKGFYSILGQGEMISIIIYFTAPTIAILSSILVGYFLKKITPQFYSLLTGGR
ncbi:MAG: acyltransferase family protein [Saprospiraceae bacterium]